MKKLILINVNISTIPKKDHITYNVHYSYLIESIGFCIELRITRYMMPENDIKMMISIGIKNTSKPIAVL